MSYYFRLGKVPHKRHTQFRQPDGSLYHEELMGIRGFTGDKSLLYHLRPPTEVHRIEQGSKVELTFAEPGPVRHRLLCTAELEPSGDAVSGRIPLLANDDVCMSVVLPDRPMTYWYRYAHGDEAIFVHEGTGVFESQFGTLRYGPGDYLVIPTGVIWRIVPDAAVEQRMLVVESSGGHIEPPRRYVNQYGQFLESAPYAERDLRPPDTLVTHDEEGEFEVRVKARGYIGRYLYRHHPLDVVGWDGHLWPFAFNIEDFEPITGRVHQPPPVHQTFDGPGFVLVFVCAAAVRLSPAIDPGALQPFERRFRRDHLLRERGFHVAAGNPGRVADRASQRHPAWSASRHVRGFDWKGSHGRTGCHGRHVPSAQAHDARREG